jgi:hypothetical protein
MVSLTTYEVFMLMFLKMIVNTRINLSKAIREFYPTENTAVGIRCADHAPPSIRKSWH